MKKRKLENIVMVVLILAIVTSGILWVGSIQGWFDKDDGSGAVLSAVRGVVTMERDGVAFAAEADTVLRNGDKLTCDQTATADIVIGESTMTLREGAAVEMTDAAAFTVTSGVVLLDAADAVTLTFDGRDIEFADAVASLSVRAGAQSVSVFAGTVETAGAGQTIDWVGGEAAVSDLTIQSLNDAAITWLRAVNETKVLCFTNADLDALEAERLAEQQALLAASAETVPLTEEADEKADESEEAETPTETDSEAPSAQQTETTATTTKPSEPVKTNPTCTFTIRCDTILDNWDSLDPAKAGYVPANGIILSTSTVEFTEGETVFDVLCRICDLTGLQIEYSWTPMYDSYYVEGLNHLYEFDCGSESGWMYKVNGWFPNYGCSSYTLQDGDAVVWCYTCIGLGADVGGSNR